MFLLKFHFYALQLIHLPLDLPKGAVSPAVTQTKATLSDGYKHLNPNGHKATKKGSMFSGFYR